MYLFQKISIFNRYYHSITMVKLKGRKGRNEIRLFILLLFVKQALTQSNTPTQGIREIFNEVRSKYKIREIRGINTHIALLKSRGYIHYNDRLRRYSLSKRHLNVNTLLSDFIENFDVFQLDQPIYEFLSFLTEVFPDTSKIPLQPFFTIMEKRRGMISWGYNRYDEENRANMRGLWSNRDEKVFEFHLINLLLDLNELTTSLKTSLYRWDMFNKLTKSHPPKKGDIYSNFFMGMEDEYQTNTRKMMSTIVTYIARLDLLKEEKTLNNFYELFIDIIYKYAMSSMDKTVKEHGEVLKDIRDETDHVEEIPGGVQVYKKPYTTKFFNERIEGEVWQRKRTTYPRKTLRDRTKFYFYDIDSTTDNFVSKTLRYKG